jgi:hypothetical protein
MVAPSLQVSRLVLRMSGEKCFKSSVLVQEVADGFKILR